MGSEKLTAEELQLIEEVLHEEEIEQREGPVRDEIRRIRQKCAVLRSEINSYSSKESVK